METYTKTNNRCQYVCFCSATMLTSQIIAEITENRFEFSCRANSWTKFV